MKFSKLLFFALGLLFFASCGDDPNPEELIVGTWELSSIVNSNCSDPDENDSQIFGDAGCEDIVGTIVCSTASLSFTAPSTARLSFDITADGESVGNESQTGTYSFADNGMLTICFDGDCDEGTLTISETSMTWVISDSEDGCDVTVKGSK